MSEVGPAVNSTGGGGFKARFRSFNGFTLPGASRRHVLSLQAGKYPYFLQMPARAKPVMKEGQARRLRVSGANMGWGVGRLMW